MTLRTLLGTPFGKTLPTLAVAFAVASTSLAQTPDAGKVSDGEPVAPATPPAVLPPTAVPIAAAISQAQRDSMLQLYIRYQEVLAKADQINAQVGTLGQQQSQFKELLESNNERIQRITDKDLYSVKLQWEARRARLLNSTDFAQSATVSLNAIRQFDATINYLNSIAALNNPDNGELGFTLVEQMTILLDKEIIQGRSKVNGVAVDKLRTLTQRLLENPIMETVATAVPAVGSMKSMLGLVTNLALGGKDVDVDEVAKFQRSMQAYVDHYNSLAAAGTDFHQSLVNLTVRKEGLEQVLRQFVEERVQVSQVGGANVDLSRLKDQSITEVVNRHYTRTEMETYVKTLEASAKGNDFNLLVEPKLAYPDYAVSQAKFIRDETLSLGREYVTIFRTYQRSIKATLETSKAIGKAKLIEAKMATLDKQLEVAIAAFDESVNAGRLDDTFKKLK